MSLLTCSLPEKPAFPFFLFPLISLLLQLTFRIVPLFFFLFLDNVAIDVIVWQATGPQLHYLIAAIVLIVVAFLLPE